jgi:hypothetical protein
MNFGNNTKYCDHVQSIVNNQFVANIRDEYGYLFNLIPVASNPSNDIQRLLCDNIRAYQRDHVISVKRDFLMDFDEILLAKFFIDRIYNKNSAGTTGDTLETLLQQINPPTENINAAIDEIYNEFIVNNDTSIPLNDDKLHDTDVNNIETNEVAANNEFNETYNETHNETQNETQNNSPNVDIDDVIEVIKELSEIELEINYADNIPLTIEFDKEPISDEIVSYVENYLSIHCAGVYRNAVDKVQFEVMLVGENIYNFSGNEMNHRTLLKVLLLLSPSFAYNIIQVEFKDKPLDIDLNKASGDVYLSNYSVFYGSNLFSDCVLEISGYKVYAHRVILSNESDVFYNYYNGTWAPTDNITTPFRIEADPILFNKILDFLYTRRLHTENTAELIDLYQIADYYHFANVLRVIEANVYPTIMVAIRQRLYAQYQESDE